MSLHQILSHAFKKSAKQITKSLMAVGLAGTVSTVAAHDQWANGDPVPAWVKKSCCGPQDAHHLNPDQVHLKADGWHVDGYPNTIPIGTELPSQDGDYWIFYSTLDNGDKSRVYCFFTPFNGAGAEPPVPANQYAIVPSGPGW